MYSGTWMGLQAPIWIIESSLNIYKHPWHLTQFDKGGGNYQYTWMSTIKNSTNDRYFLLGQIYSTQKVHYSVYLLWFNLILGLNLLFFCFKLIIIQYYSQKTKEKKI